MRKTMSAQISLNCSNFMMILRYLKSKFLRTALLPAPDRSICNIWELIFAMLLENTIWSIVNLKIEGLKSHEYNFSTDDHFIVMPFSVTVILKFCDVMNIAIYL